MDILSLLKLKFELGLIRNHYVGRTFIEPTQNIRSFGVKLKLSSTKSILKNKSIILIDDSLFEELLAVKLLKMLYKAGAKESSCKNCLSRNKISRFLWCRYANKKELLSSKKNKKKFVSF